MSEDKAALEQGPIDLAREAEFALGDMLVRPATREIVISGAPRSLQPRVMQVFVALARRGGAVLARDDLVRECWEGLSVSEDAINRCISQLRRLSEQTEGRAFTIETVARVGYRLLAAEPPEPSAAPEAELSIVVIPFANTSPDKDQEYFSDGLSEDLINQLAQIDRLRVVGRTSSFALKGRTDDLRTIGQKLGVTHVLEGSVRKSGNRVRITAQLIDGKAGDHVWAGRYDRDLSDIFALQDEISQAIITALKLKLLPEEKKSIENHGTDNPEAYDKYLRARALYYQSGSAELLRAIEIFREALALDPDFALAWYGLYMASMTTLMWIPKDAARKEMAEANVHVLELAPDAWWTHALRTQQFIMERKWTEADAAAKAALAAASASDVDAAHACASFQWTVGCCKETIEHLERARRADPLSLVASGFLQLALDDAGRPDDAQVEYERSKDLAGDHGLWDWAAVTRLWRRKGADPSAIKAQYGVFLRNQSRPMALHRVLLDRLDDMNSARVAIRQAFEDPANQDSLRMAEIVCCADHFGDKDLALAALRRTFLELNGISYSMLWYPSEIGFRTDPRFKMLIRDLGIYGYWRTSGKWGDFARAKGDDDFEIIK